MQWVLSGYALTFGVVLVAAGRAGDLVGRGGMFIIGVIVYTAAAVLAGFAPSAEALNIARFMQGVGAGLFNPQSVGMLQQYFQGPERGRAFGYYGATVGIAVAIGPVIGGLLIELGGADLGWRLTMLVNVPVGLIALLLAFRSFPRPLLSRVRDRRTGRKVGTWNAFKSLDPIGALLLGTAVFMVLFPFVESSGSRWAWVLLPFGLGFVWLWVAWERRHKAAGHQPMVDLRIFRAPSFRNGATIAGLWFMGATSIWVLVALYFQNGLGYSALVAGCVGIPSALLNSVSSTVAGRLVSKHGRKVVIGGMLIAIFRPGFFHHPHLGHHPLGNLGMVASTYLVIRWRWSGLSNLPQPVFDAVAGPTGIRGLFRCSIANRSAYRHCHWLGGCHRCGLHHVE